LKTNSIFIIDLMKKFLFTLIALVLATAASAVPARPGLWKTISLADGSILRVELCGDEFGCYWQTADGRFFVCDNDNHFFETTQTELNQRRFARLSHNTLRSSVLRHSHPRLQKSQSVGNFIGKKKGLIILVEFQNKKFLAGHDRAYYERVANELGFSEGDYQGSVKDYFLSQSKGLFELDFDVVGPYTVSHNYEYYGQPSSSNLDAHPWEMIVEACQQAATDGIHFTDYDWNGDGECEQVFVLYAGEGQSDSYDANTIWPHEFELTQVKENGESVYPTAYFVGGCYVDTYACSNELTSKGGPSGIGTMCHEFSHCMGLPDLYDVYYGGNFGMGHWDLMANGVYNGNAFCPASYTSYERMVCGWLNPVELQADTLVNEMKPLSEGGTPYIIYNQAHPDEYYLLENRQQSGWDAGLPSNGMLVLHVDYDEKVWMDNIVNSTVDYRGVPGMNDQYNTHPRLTLIHADNENDKRFWRSSSQAYIMTTEQTDPYPYLWVKDDGEEMVNDSLTDNSLPAATLYNANTDGSLFMNRGIKDITQHTDGTMAFRFESVSMKYVNVDTTLTEKPDLSGAIFYESFNRCIGTGGNDGLFKGSSDVASAEFIPDNDGWESMAMTGGARCAKFGNAANDGIVTTPGIMLTGETLELSFKAAPWSRDDTSLSLSVSGNGQLEQSSFTMTEGQWGKFKTTITGNGRITITFTPGRRFFLDEVLLRDPSASGIIHISTDSPTNMRYDLLGRKVSPSLPSNAHHLRLVRKADGSYRKVLQ